MRVVVVGLEFGAEFVPIYADHPGVTSVGVADLRAELATQVARRFDADHIYPDLDAALADPAVDAVHLVTGLTAHADQVVRALAAGKHVACTVPMALSFDDLDRIVAARRAAGTTYMMMETAVYTREFLWARELAASGGLGRVSYARGTHFQDMTGWPSYWRGLPPMYYATHAVAPILALLGTRATAVRALGGGRLDPANQGGYGNPFPVQSALVEVAGADAVVEITRSLFQLARSYTESFSIYGDRQAIEWPQLEADGEHPILFTMDEATADSDDSDSDGHGDRGGRGRPVKATRVEVPDRADLLPEPIRKYTRQFAHAPAGDAHAPDAARAGAGHRSFVQGGGHGGSHPHLVHEFVSSVQAGRAPFVDDLTAANWTATGIAAHQSALRGGERVAIPHFE
jgi:predicted dehydrogenase